MIVFWIVFIPLTIVTMGFCIYTWRKEVKEYTVHGFYIDDCLEYMGITFLMAPGASFVGAFLAAIIVDLFGFWLIPIVLIVSSVLGFVYWDCIKEYISSKRGEQ